ncbi:hypothetical protein AB0H28_24430 [Micromonospora sp. NPDC050980]|uniref:RCC1 domain-containing protein n=1 Tax=Micromonospora sp. NPDC050980 TaxID=3155161 RepID=UPI0033D2E716
MLTGLALLLVATGGPAARAANQPQPPPPPSPASAWLDDVVSVSVGGGYSGALRSDGTVLIWGEIIDDEIEFRAGQPFPRQVCDVGQLPPCTRFLDRVTAIAVGNDHALALRSDGTVVGWGLGVPYGAGVGDGTNRNSGRPTQVCDVGQVAPCTRFLDRVTAISVSHGYSMALRSDGTVVTWGTGYVGDGTTGTRLTPLQVCDVGQTAPCIRFLDRVTAISTSGEQGMAVRADGTVVTWGTNLDGVLGNGLQGTPGDGDDRLTPVRVCDVGQSAPCTTFLDRVVAVAGDYQTGVASRSDGTAVAWGTGYTGDGTVAARLTPVRICDVGQTAPCTRFLDQVTDVSSELLLRADGTVVGRVGRTRTPEPVCDVGQTEPCTRFLDRVTAIARGFDSGAHLAVRSDGTVAAWGWNRLGQLGDGTTISRPTPVLVCNAGRTTPCPIGP